MPYAPASPCAEPGCGRLVNGSRCDEHARSLRRAYRGRPERVAAKRFYSSARWQRVRRVKLGQDPLCEEPGCGELAVDVHHVKPWQESPELALVIDNLESLCKACHNRKRARSSGRGGREM